MFLNHLKYSLKNFKVLGLDVKILSGDEEEIEMRDTEDEDEMQQAESFTLSPSEPVEAETEKVGSKISLSIKDSCFPCRYNQLK